MSYHFGQTRQTKITDFRRSRSVDSEEASNSKVLKFDGSADKIKRKMSEDIPPEEPRNQKHFKISQTSFSHSMSESLRNNQRDYDTTETDPKKSDKHEAESDKTDEESDKDDKEDASDEDEAECDEKDEEPHEDEEDASRQVESDNDGNDEKCTKNQGGDYFDNEETSSPLDRMSPGSHEATDEYPDDQADSSENENEEEGKYETTSSPRIGATHAGTPVKELHRESLGNLRKLPELNNSETHCVLSKNQSNGFVWSEKYVRMPCDPQSEMVIFKKKGKETVNRWGFIKSSLKPSRIRNVFQLEDAILKYNGHRKQLWDFECLKTYFLESKYAEEKRDFFDRVLPKIIECALLLEVLFKESIPLLKKNEARTITMTQNQAACLLANAFLCTFPWRNKNRRQSVVMSLPTINFSSLFNTPVTDNRLEKIKCIIHYFNRVTEKMPDGVITFRKQVISDSDFPDWDHSKTKLTRLHVSSEGTIEDDGAGMLQVDFANKMVGGGVIGHGCVQEEIRFLICPEMIVSRLVTEVLEGNEVLIMTGCERFSNYSGYASSFVWSGNYEDKEERDKWGRKHTEVVAMDALPFGKDINVQYSTSKVDRELNKAYCAFLCKDGFEGKLPAVCTGNWGCGAFGGNKELKALLQLMAASEAGRDVLYFTFHDKELVRSLNYVHSKLKEFSISIGEMVKLLREFNRTKEYKRSTVFKFFKENCF